MKKTAKIFALFLFQIVFLTLAYAQEFYICTGPIVTVNTSPRIPPQLRKVDISNCTSQLKVSFNNITYTDITFHPSGKLYGTNGLNLYEIDTLTGNGLFLTFFLSTNSTTSFTSLTCNAQGVIYTMGDSGELYSYNPQTRVKKLLGTVKVDGAIIGAAGDLTFYKGDLYAASTQNSLVKIDLSDPANSSIYMNFNTSSNIFGIVSFVECGVQTTYATTNAISSRVYKIDWTNRVLVSVCQTFDNIFGGASRDEFKASLVSLDTARLVNFTCDPLLQKVLPPRILRNQFGCDSVVLEKTVLLKLDTTKIFNTTCDPQKVRNDLLHLQNIAGCDSLVILQTKLDNDSIQKSWKICRGDSFNFYNQWLRQTGFYTKTFKKSSGCDSVIALQLQVFDKQTVVKDSFVCQTNRVGRDSILLQNIDGCDSLIVHNRLIAPRVNEKTPLNWQTCRGDTVRIGQNRFYTEGVHTVILKNQYGCDSTINLTLQLLKKDTTIIQTATCDPKKNQRFTHRFEKQTRLRQPNFYKTQTDSEPKSSQ